MYGTTFSERLKGARKEANLSQAAVAAELKIAQSTISQAEAYGSQGSAHVASFARLYHVDAYWLETGKGLRRSADAEAIPHVSDRDARTTTAELLIEQMRGILKPAGLDADEVLRDLTALKARIERLLRGTASAPTPFLLQADPEEGEQIKRTSGE
jgi:transcriptional regulator with XRE-family HTH domain